MTGTRFLPQGHARFLDAAVARLREDPRIVAIAIGGSYLTRRTDEFSDLDLILAVEPAEYAAVSEDRKRIAAAIGPLLAAFTGEHVGEPRLLICLYGPPLLHVDLKFVSVADVGMRVEDPAILYERDRRFRAAIEASPASYPPLDRQWIEDRFWIWVHYGAGKIGRGELFEAIDLLAFLRRAIELYRKLRESAATPTSGFRANAAAEAAATEYLREIESRGA